MSNSLPMLNGDKTGVGDFSTDASANMVAAIRDHISCTKPVQVETFVTQDTKAGIIYPCDFDHMYASLAEGAVVERENLEVRHLKDLLLLHLDLIQQQSEQLVTKERQISSLRQENETLRQRLERMDRRVNLHKQRDGLTPTCEAAAIAVAASVDHSSPLQLDSGYIVPKVEPTMLPMTPTVMLASLSPTPQQYYRPPTPFQRKMESFDEARQSPPLSTFVPPPPMQLCELAGTDSRVPSTSFASPMPTAAADVEPVKRRKTDELELPLQVLPAQAEMQPTEQVPGTRLDSGGDDEHTGALETDCERHGSRSVPAWVSCTGRRRRRNYVRHGRSNEGESSVTPPSQSPTDGAAGSLPHLTGGLVRRGRRLPRNRHVGRRSGGRSSRRRLGSAVKNIMSTDHPYWTTIGELPSALRLHDGLRSDYTNVEVPSWRHKVYTSCYAMEGTENLDDEVFSKRHQRYESDERRRKRWDVQRIREQRHVEKLRQQQAARATPTAPARSSGGRRDDCPLATLWPSPEDVTFVEIGEKLPVAAFGAPVVNFHPNEFSLPWKWRTALQEKVLRRSNHGPYAAQDSRPIQSHGEVGVARRR